MQLHERADPAGPGLVMEVKVFRVSRKEREAVQAQITVRSTLQIRLNALSKGDKKVERLRWFFDVAWLISLA